MDSNKKSADEEIKCNCGCEEEICECEEQEDIITLTSDDGEQLDFYHEATIEYEDDWYVFLNPVKEMEEIGEDEVVIFKLVKSEEGEDSLEPIEDEDLLDKVYEKYVAMIDSYEDEDYEDDDSDDEEE